MRSPGRLLALGAVALSLAAACGGHAPTPAAAPSTAATPSRLLGVEAFADLIAANPGTPVINVHVPYEGHIPGTTDFVAYDSLASWEGLPAGRDDLIILYCRSGSMSARAAADLAANGYTDVVDLQGGMNAWTAAGRTLAHDDPTAT